MKRFLPNQLQTWTGGRLLRNKKTLADNEVFYFGISTDTRTIRQGEAFLALKGENFDGHNFIETAIAKGAAMLIVEEKAAKTVEIMAKAEELELPDLLLVADTLKAYMAIAAGYRQTLEACIIGVTGSVGKTTTRQMIHQLIKAQINAHQSEANLNNQIGISSTLLGTNADVSVLALEIAIDRIGEMIELSALTRPDIAVITGIGYSHAEYLGSPESILKEKLDLLEFLRENGLAVINGNDKRLRDWAFSGRKKSKYALWFVASEDNKSLLESKGFPVFYFKELELSKSCTSFRVACSFVPGEEWLIELPFAAPHLVEAVLFALASAFFLGLDMRAAAKDATGFSNTGSRQKILNLDQNVCLLDDSYNSSPEAMQSGLTTLSFLAEPKKRIGIFGAIRELGQYAREVHLEIAAKIMAMGFRELLLIGEEMKIVQEYLQDNQADILTTWHNDREELEQKALQTIKAGDAVMIKGSNSFGLGHTAALIKQYFGGDKDD